MGRRDDDATTVIPEIPHLLAAERPPPIITKAKEVKLRFYTGRGDDGTTDLLGGRVDKDDLRIEALGALDEATSAIGLGRAIAENGQVQSVLIASQRDL